VSDAEDMDTVFRALADPTRRHLLDRLRAHNGQTLGELCSTLGMTRQSATQHLDLLVDANLVAVVRHGRERRHYLNPVPIHEIGQRWIARFDLPHLNAISAITARAEEQAMTEPTPSTTTQPPDYVYVTYIRASPEQVWQALTDPDLTAQYWGHRNISTWEPGATWEHRRADGSDHLDVAGTILEAEPPTRLVFTFHGPDEQHPAPGPSVVTCLIEPAVDLIRLTVTHRNLPDAGMYAGISRGWPVVLANLKTLLETDTTLPPAIWAMADNHD
jgi:uncharacterized protein YndB with AHSA1/START domain/DNA-binding transcriptional ArsR family regulator